MFAAQNEVTLKLDERLMENGAPIRNGAHLGDISAIFGDVSDT